MNTQVKIYPMNARTIISEMDGPKAKLEVRTMRRFLKARCKQARQASK